MPPSHWKRIDWDSWFAGWVCGILACAVIVAVFL